MVYTYVDLVVMGKVSKVLRALVDAGSAYVVMDSKSVSEVGLYETPFTIQLTLADNRGGQGEALPG